MTPHLVYLRSGKHFLALSEHAVTGCCQTGEVHVQRVAAIAVVTIGVLVAGLYLVVSWLWLVFVGVLLLGVGVSWLWEVRRREPSEGEDRQAIRTLWKLTRRIPAGRILVDPVTRRQFGIHRRGGTVNLIVPRYLHDDASTDNPHSDKTSTDDVLVTHYLVGSFGLPHPPPLLRHEEVIRAHEEGPVPNMSKKDARATLAFNEETGALNVDREEIAALTAALERALHNR